MIPVNKPCLVGNEKKYLIDCIDSGWISSEGPYVQAFEDLLSLRVKRKHGIAVSNGTAAIDAAVVALDIGVGDEVIMPAFTIISCVNQVVRSGATPVLIDSDPLTWNMNVSLIEKRITARTKAIFVAHIYGLPVDLNPVLEIAKKYNLKIIEDAAEMHGQEYRGQPCGSFGDISIFSFYPNKHITTGEGGMILTNDDNLAERCRSLRNLCFQPEKRFVHEQLGWNLRMTNMQAALGVAQLEQLETFIEKKRAMGRLYNKLLQGLPGAQLPLDKTEYADNIYWVYGLVIHEDLGVDAGYVMRELNNAGIGTRPFFCPMHQQPILKKMGFFPNETYPVSENMYKNGFYVPSGLALEDFEIEQVAEALWKIFNQLQK